MRGFRFFSRLLSFIVALLLALGASVALALPNAYFYANTPNRGVRASIVTANPTLRNDPSGKWSYMRVFVRRFNGASTYYAEIGWLKGDQPESNGTPRAY